VSFLRPIFWYRYHQVLARFRSIDSKTLIDIGLNRDDFQIWARASAKLRTYFSAELVIVRELNGDDIDRCAEFAMHVAPFDVHLRFGRAIDITDRTLCKQYLISDKKTGRLAMAALNLDNHVLGIGSLAPAIDNTAEVALLVRSDMQQKGIGSILLCNLVRQAQMSGYDRLSAILEGHQRHLVAPARKFGFCSLNPRTASSIGITKKLRAHPVSPALRRKRWVLVMNEMIKRAQPQQSAAVNRTGIFRRFCDSLTTWSHSKRIEPKLEELVRRNGGRMTDDLEREMMKILTGGSDWWR
jgi:GNAT superfamily N-acetyltransferase